VCATYAEGAPHGRKARYHGCGIQHFMRKGGSFETEPSSVAPKMFVGLSWMMQWNSFETDWRVVNKVGGKPLLDLSCSAIM
jgi:hypothetical protein